MDRPITKLVNYLLSVWSSLKSGNYRLDTSEKKTFIGVILVVIGLLGLLLT